MNVLVCSHPPLTLARCVLCAKTAPDWIKERLSLRKPCSLCLCQIRAQHAAREQAEKDAAALAEARERAAQMSDADACLFWEKEEADHDEYTCPSGFCPSHPEWPRGERRARCKSLMKGAAASIGWEPELAEIGRGR